MVLAVFERFSSSLVQTINRARRRRKISEITLATASGSLLALFQQYGTTKSVVQAARRRRKFSGITIILAIFEHFYSILV